MNRIARFAIIAALTAGASACVYIEADEDTNIVRRKSCDAAQHQSLVGQKGFTARTRDLPGELRVVCHDCVTTMDFNEDRLTVRLDAEGRVVSATCG